MKKNHQQVEIFIRQAIAACSYDNALTDTKSYLTRALQSIAEVGKKRTRRLASEKAFEEGKKKADAWWDMIKKNAANNINLKEPEEEQ
jgi:hypothetical protein